MIIVGRQFANNLSSNWWVLLLRGMAAILFGVVVWLQSRNSPAALVMLFGSYAFVDGTLGAGLAISGRREHEHWWVLLLGGLLGVGIGLLTFLIPEISGLILLFYIATWATSTGVLQIVVALRLRKEMKGERTLLLGGVLSVGLGVILMSRPTVAALAVQWILVLYAVVFGALLVVLAIRVRSLEKRLAGV